jgi:hypothetical protein
LSAIEDYPTIITFLSTVSTGGGGTYYYLLLLVHVVVLLLLVVVQVVVSAAADARLVFLSSRMYDEIVGAVA